MVTSFFGIHWSADVVENSAANIANSLKHQGIVAFLVGIDADDLFNARKKFLKQGKYKDVFENFRIRKIIDDAQKY